MLWGGMWEGGSCLGMHVRIKDFKMKKIKKRIRIKESGKTLRNERYIRLSILYPQRLIYS